MAGHQFTIDTPLGDQLEIMSMQGSEPLGRMFKYDLYLKSPSESIKMDDILGENVTLNLELASGETRYFNGYITHFSQVGRTEDGYATYEATAHPWLWFLTRTKDCRIFQEKAVPDILLEVFGDLGFTDYEDTLGGSYEPREYCVQYRESDFNFVSRLMEQEGIYYYFKHDKGIHTLILSDSINAHETVPDYESIPYYPPQKNASRREEHISDLNIRRKLQSGTYVLNDYDFKRPNASLKVQRLIPRDHAQAEYEVYDYPGSYVESSAGEQYARVRIEELHVNFEQIECETDARGIMAGGLFELTNYPREDQNREYLVVHAFYDIESAESSGGAGGDGQVYECSFTAIDSKTPFHSASRTPQPTVKGPQTALVVGPSGEEIYPDNFGRIKVQFYWDRYGNKDENSSCWVRVVQSWAGGGWGAQFLPRLGQEVMVEFLEGDPDRPVITGRVYNADNMPTYGLPDNKTQSGIKTRSSKGGAADNCNEIRFEDKMGSEELYIQAEKDHNQVTKNNRSESVGTDRSLSVGNDKSESIGNNKTIDVGTDHTETIGANEAITVGSNETITVGVNKTLSTGANHTETVGSNMTISVGANLTETVAINYAETVGVAMELTVGALMAETVGANKEQNIGISKNVNIGKDKSEDIGANKKVSVGKDQNVKVGKKLVFDAGEEITIKTGKASIVMKKDGTITISGKDITINGKGKIQISASKDMMIKSSKDITMKGKKILQN